MAADVANSGDKTSTLGLIVATSKEDRKALLLAVRRQLEWYFSDANLSADQLLHDRISQARNGGWLSCMWLMQVKQIIPFRATSELIVEALRGSHLETRFAHKSKDKRHGTDQLRCLFLRRRQPLPPLLRSGCQGLCGEVLADPVKAVLKDPHATLNRLRDRWHVQERLQIKEVGDGSTVFLERSQKEGAAASDLVLAVGYERVLYGDGGPYIELNRQQVRWDAWPHFHNKKGYRNSYYDEYYTNASHRIWSKRWRQWAPHPNAGLLMLYAQKHHVKDRPWAPSANTKPHAWRKHGYADYRPGYYYLAADDNLIAIGREGSRLLTRAKRDDAGNGADGKSCAANGTAGWNFCWNYKAGRCDRGAHCKWRHA